MPGRLAGLDTPPDLVGHLIELALDGDAALVQLVHTGMPITDRVQPVARRRSRLSEKLGSMLTARRAAIAVAGEAARRPAVQPTRRRIFAVIQRVIQPRCADVRQDDEAQRSRLLG